MFRWHSERSVMMKRYRIELGTHVAEGGMYRRWPWRAMAPVSHASGISCHCARGIGTMRKHRPGVCEKRRCSCKRYKRHDPRRSDLILRAYTKDAYVD